MGELRIQEWKSGVHVMLAEHPAGWCGQVNWACSCGSNGIRTTALLIHMVAIAEAGEDIDLHFQQEEQD